MAHTTKVVGYDPLSNFQFRVTIRCCGDAGTDFPHTLATTMSKEERTASIAQAKELCAKRHQGMLDGEDHAIEIMGEEAQHDDSGKIIS